MLDKISAERVRMEGQVVNGTVHRKYIIVNHIEYTENCARHVRHFEGKVECVRYFDWETL
jgi:hypothetical protein